MVCIGLHLEVAQERAVILALNMLVQCQLLWVQQLEISNVRLMAGAVVARLVTGAGDRCGLGRGGVGVGVEEMEVAECPVRGWALVAGGVPRDLVRVENVVSLCHCRVFC